MQFLNKKFKIFLIVHALVKTMYLLTYVTSNALANSGSAALLDTIRCG